MSEPLDARELRRIGHQAVTEGVSLAYVETMRRALYEAADRIEQLEAGEQPKPFVVSVKPATLTVEQVWPDGGAPDNPTAEDVAEVMRGYGTAQRTLAEWNLLDEVTVDGTVVW